MKAFVFLFEVIAKLLHLRKSMILKPILKTSLLARDVQTKPCPGGQARGHGEKRRQKGDFMRCMSFAIASLMLVLPAYGSLEELNTRVQQDLKQLPYPATWREDAEEILEVVIVGSGMAGMASAFGLKRVGIHRILLLDQSKEGEEGPWTHVARMRTLRSDKEGTGPCQMLPSLSFYAWYEAKWGEEKWNELTKATPQEWMEYLCWFKKVLNLPVVNECKVLKITPLQENLFKIDCTQGSYHARKVVLATGRDGFGGFEIPDFMANVPKKFFAHTSEAIDFAALKGKKIAVIGAGASAFDAAGAALEAGSAHVELLFRRKELPLENLMDRFAHAGFEQGYHLLSDEWRWKLMNLALENGTPPPESAISRVQNHSNFQLKNNFALEKVELQNYDFVILGTGFRVEGSEILEIKEIFPHILLWKDRLLEAGNFPYLGPHFQFLERNPGQAPYLKHLYCFNYGALLSHGLTSSSIDAISAGAERLSKGIAADFFQEEVEKFYEQLNK
jgi:FAD-dependent urate hydroxylase